jgi:hypothetical protein
MNWSVSMVILGGVVMLNNASGQVVTFGPVTLPKALVIGEPFSARFSERRRVGNGSEALIFDVSGRVYRDSRGRERRETEVKMPAGEGFTLIAITDFGTGEIYALDPRTHTAVLERIALASRDEPDAAGRAGPEAGVMPDIPYETVEGLRCRTFESDFGRPPTVIHVKVWFSDELGQVVREEATGGNMASSWRLSEIRRLEPDSALFSVPEGYTVRSGSAHP